MPKERRIVHDKTIKCLQYFMNTEYHTKRIDTKNRTKCFLWHFTIHCYKACYDFSLRLMHAVSHFPKEYKYSLGEKLTNQSLDLVIHIYKVNSTRDKAALLREMEEKIQLIYLLLRVSHDMKLLPTEKFAGIVEMADDIASQTKGWLKSNEKVREPVTAKA